MPEKAIGNNILRCWNLFQCRTVAVSSPIIRRKDSIFQVKTHPCLGVLKVELTENWYLCCFLQVIILGLISSIRGHATNLSSLKSIFIYYSGLPSNDADSNLVSLNSNSCSSQNAISVLLIKIRTVMSWSCYAEGTAIPKPLFFS